MRFERGQTVNEALNIGREARAYKVMTLDVSVKIPGKWKTKKHNEWKHIDPSKTKQFSITGSYLTIVLEILVDYGFEALENYIKNMGIAIHKKDIKDADQINGTKEGVKYFTNLTTVADIVYQNDGTFLEREFLNGYNLKMDLGDREIFYEGKFYTIK